MKRGLLYREKSQNKSHGTEKRLLSKRGLLCGEALIRCDFGKMGAPLNSNNFLVTKPKILYYISFESLNIQIS